MKLKLKEVCESCGKHKATVAWVGCGGVLDILHGDYQSLCKCCAIKKKIVYAIEMAREIAGLRQELRDVKCESI